MAEQVRTFPRALERNTINVCSMAGINLIIDEKIQLYNLRRGLEESIRAIDADRSFNRSMANLGLALIFVKAICDATIHIAAAFGPAQLKVIEKAYDAAGNHIGLQKNAAEGNVVGAMKNVAGLMPKGQVKTAMELKAISATIVKNAMEGDLAKAGIALLQLKLKLAKLAAEDMGGSASAKYFTAASSVVSAACDIFSVYTEIKAGLNEDDNFEKIVGGLKKQLRAFDNRIATLDATIDACAAERGIVKPSLLSIPTLPSQKGPQLIQKRL